MNDDTLPLCRKDIIPKGKRDRSLFILMFIATPGFALWELLIVLPFYHKEWSVIVYTHICCGVFIFYNIIFNMVKLMSVGTSTKDVPLEKLPVVHLPGWSHCPVCQVFAPPRSYHCRVCDECILKQDHHCMFAGKCVGFYNHRYFIIGLLYIWIGALYCILFHLEYNIHHMGGWSWWLLLGQPAPHLGWLFGVFSIYGFICGTLNLFLILCIGLTSYLLILQVQGVSRNQTMYELKHHVTRFNRGSWSRNVKEVLGPNWYLTWIGPWISSPPIGDGLYFLQDDVNAKDL